MRARTSEHSHALVSSTDAHPASSEPARPAKDSFLWKDGRSRRVFGLKSPTYHTDVRQARLSIQQRAIHETLEWSCVSKGRPCTRMSAGFAGSAGSGAEADARTSGTRSWCQEGPCRTRGTTDELPVASNNNWPCQI